MLKEIVSFYVLVDGIVPAAKIRNTKNTTYGAGCLTLCLAIYLLV